MNRIGLRQSPWGTPSDNKTKQKNNVLNHCSVVLPHLITRRLTYIRRIFIKWSSSFSIIFLALPEVLPSPLEECSHYIYLMWLLFRLIAFIHKPVLSCCDLADMMFVLVVRVAWCIRQHIQSSISTGSYKIQAAISVVNSHTAHVFCRVSERVWVLVLLRPLDAASLRMLSKWPFSIFDTCWSCSGSIYRGALFFFNLAIAVDISCDVNDVRIMHGSMSMIFFSRFLIKEFREELSCVFNLLICVPRHSESFIYCFRSRRRRPRLSPHF